MTMKKIIYNLRLLLVFSTLFNVSCREAKSPATSENAVPADNEVQMTSAQLSKSNLQIGTLSSKEMSAIIRVKGKIDVPPQKMLSISVPMGGYLQSTKLLPGMRVQKGEVLAIVSGEQYIQLQQDYLMAKEKMILLELDFKRQRDLALSQSASQKTLQQATTEYNSQQVLVQSLAQKLKWVGISPEALSKDNISPTITIKSSLSGYVTAVYVNIGKYLNPSDVLFEIMSTDDIHLAMTVYEKDIPFLKEGQEVIAHTNEQPEVKHRCSIILIGREISESRSVEVHCHFMKEAVHLLPGTYMNAEIKVKKQMATVLPDEAIVQYNNKNYVFVQTDSLSFGMREVKTGIAEKGYTTISGAGLTATTPVVVKGTYTLLMMLKNKQED